MAIKITEGKSALNSNPNLVHVHIPVHDIEWFDFRYGGIAGVYEGGFGASEVAKVLGAEKEDYRPVLPELLQWKAGLREPERNINEATLSGILAEDSILERWEYWDNTPDGYLNNYLLGKKMRKHQKVNAYIYNKRFPWLFASLDSSIVAGQSSLSGVVLDKFCPLELKTMNFMVKKNSFEETMTKYTYQATTQMLVTETDYAEIAVLTGGSKFEVYHFDFDPELAKIILEKTYEAWQLVLQLRAIAKQMVKASPTEREELQALAQSLLPLPVSGDGYGEYYSDQYQDAGEPTSTIDGNEDMFELIRERLKVAKLASKLDDKAQQIDNHFKNIFVQRQANVIDFGGLGKLKYIKQTGWKAFTTDYRGIKEKADLNIIEPVYLQTLQLLK